jgi:hypothetical protein
MLQSTQARRDLVENLKLSSRNIGSLYPILIDFHGNIIDGEHRLEADQEWPRRRLEQVKTERQKIVVRLISNACRREVSAREKTEMLDKLSEILLGEGIRPGKISKSITEEIGMSYTWVMKYLPKKYKDSSHSREIVSTTRRVARANNLYRLSKSPRERFISISRYTNSNHAIYTVNLRFHERVENAAKTLKTTSSILVQNAIENELNKVERLYMRLKF